MKQNRREFLRTTALATLATALLPSWLRPKSPPAAAPPAEAGAFFQNNADRHYVRAVYQAKAHAPGEAVQFIPQQRGQVLVGQDLYIFQDRQWVRVIEVHRGPVIDVVTVRGKSAHYQPHIRALEKMLLVQVTPVGGYSCYNDNIYFSVAYDENGNVIDSWELARQNAKKQAS